MLDGIVIGAGVAGAVVARELAERGNQRILVIEQREHVGGNCYDREDKYGIRIHQYGPHIFHTNHERVFEYLSRFTKWRLFPHEVVANVHGKMIPIPFNLNTLYRVYDKEIAEQLEKKLIEAYGFGSRVPILELMNHEDEEIKSIADYIYENIFLYYTMKQWGQKPEEIDPQVTGRVPVITSFDNRYFQDKYQGMPVDGYSELFENLLNHPNIEVRLRHEAKKSLRITENQVFFNNEPFWGKVIYTGPIDELFDLRYGALPYRSLNFVFENYKKADYQGHSVVNYTVSEDFTRITEFKHLTGQKNEESTTILKEYPMDYKKEKGDVPCYAIINEVNQFQYQKYVTLTEHLSNFYLLGRLAEYKYYNIDTMVEKALGLADQLLKEEENNK